MPAGPDDYTDFGDDSGEEDQLDDDYKEYTLSNTIRPCRNTTYSIEKLYGQSCAKLRVLRP